MFISHLKRSHKTGDRAHELSTGHKSSRETEHVRKSTSIRVPRIEENRFLASRDGRRSKLELSAPSLASFSFENANESLATSFVKCNLEGRIFRRTWKYQCEDQVRLSWEKFENRSAMIGLDEFINGDSIKCFGRIFFFFDKFELSF